MIKECRFWTKDGVAVIMRPETKEQLEQVLWMGRMWQINHLGNCGPDYAVEFARQHQIKYAWIISGLMSIHTQSFFQAIPVGE